MTTGSYRRDGTTAARDLGHSKASHQRAQVAIVKTRNIVPSDLKQFGHGRQSPNKWGNNVTASAVLGACHIERPADSSEIE